MTQGLVEGLKHHASYLDRPAQEQVLADIRACVAAAPLFRPVTRWGKPMSVQMSSAGLYGWYSDRRGYRYERTHPSGVAWPPIPPSVLNIWQALVPEARAPQCCLINYYAEGTRMGLHVDNDEADFTQPVLSISLGDDALFRVGGLERGDPTSSVWLSSGDVVVLGGDARLCHHGIDRVKTATSDLLRHGGRINLTLRVVD